MAELSNNPFVDHTASVAARYPSLDTIGSPPQAQYSGWGQPQQSQYLQQQQQQPQYQQQQQPPQYSYPQQQQYQPTGYQIQSPVGQSGYLQQQQQPQQYAQPTGYAQQQQYTYPQQQQQQQPQQYGYAPQQQQQQPGYGSYQYGGNGGLAQFDPYANLGQSFGQQQQQQPQPTGYPSSQLTGSSSGGGGSGIGPAGQQHPRQFIQTYKADLEKWDPVAWKQCLNSFDSLRDAWADRKMTIEARIKVYGGTPGAATGLFGGQQQQQAGYGYGYGGYNPQAQEIERLNGVLKEATNNVDTILAAKFQMSEVQNSYRHSSDAASKRRVREATNAALHGLPDWPSPNF